MGNVKYQPPANGLQTLIRLHQGPLSQGPRIKVQLDAGKPDRANTVSVSIHDPAVVEGRLASTFAGSQYHALVKQFIARNQALLLLHAAGEIDDELRDKLERVQP